MNTLLQTNIDDIRAEIMRLEDAKVFDQQAWAKVLMQLAGHDTRRADAARRMETAKANQASACTDLALYVPPEEEALEGVIIEHPGVAVETGCNTDGMLKAYWVQFVDDEWGMFIHAVSAGKAKSIFWNSYPGTDYPEWNDIRAIRTKGADLLDITPFTDATLRYAGYDIPKPDDENYVADAFLDDCPCSMCKYERSKPEYRVDNMKQMVEA